ncbi:hypothetical protein [Cognatilysobacter bugurensis]|uniref:Uncharacterized protein n=1 Tax=Cognatilysobacter bugurensis TaxID=543356 RepID=A0A918T1A0_9GAMM|nr:hypothetical protein [Lysobacter bugurensis]GHA83372.1 hypothetical protein GCM10007067_21860 [Lysobacter bugurensis]
MPLMRKLVKLAVGYAVTKALAKHGGPKGLLDSVLNSASRAGNRDDRMHRGGYRAPGSKRGDGRR